MPQYASPRPSCRSPSPSAAEVYMIGPSNQSAIMVSGVSGPKLPRNTHSALTPCVTTSSTALRASTSFSTQIGHSYRPSPNARATLERRFSDSVIGKQLRLTEMIPSLSSGMLVILCSSVLISLRMKKFRSATRCRDFHLQGRQMRPALPRSCQNVQSATCCVPRAAYPR